MIDTNGVLLLAVVNAIFAIFGEPPALDTDTAATVAARLNALAAAKLAANTQG